MGSRKRGHPDDFERDVGRRSSKAPRGCDRNRGAGRPRHDARFSLGPPPFLDSLKDHLREQLPVLPLLREGQDELARALDGVQLRQADVYCLVQGLRRAAEEAQKEEDLLAILQPVVHSPFLVRGLLWFVAGLGNEGVGLDWQATDDVVALLRQLTLALPEAVRPLVHVPADMLQAKLQRWLSQGRQLPWPTRRRLWDLRRQVDEAFPGGGGRKREDSFSEERPKKIQDLSVFPTSQDLLGSADPWALPNTVEGAYESGRAYLDAHFHLLREDFLSPLRDGIAACLAPASRWRKVTGTLEVYREVRVLHPDCQREGVVYKVRLDRSAFRQGVCLALKRLSKGSLVCLFAADCERIFPAIVAKWNAKLLAQGYLWLRFAAGHSELVEHLFRHDFSMVDSPAFFEAYRHVLRGLQEMEPGCIPFKRYVVACKARVRPPRYLQPHSTSLDLRPLLRAGDGDEWWGGLEAEGRLTQEQGTAWDPAEERDLAGEDHPGLPEAEDSKEEEEEDEPANPGTGTDGGEEGVVPAAGKNTGPVEEFISIEGQAAEEGDNQAGKVRSPQQADVPLGAGAADPTQQARSIPGRAGSLSGESKYVVNPFKQDLRSLRWLRHLDRSQLKALQKALTREFAIVQGAPGTGKIFVGLKLVQLLLHNQRLWQDGEVTGGSRPILVVCNTNHTLDLFLEGLLEVNCSKIVRIGGFCKNRKLKQFTLENIRETRLQEMLTPRQRRRFKEVKEKIEGTKANVMYCSKILDMLPLGILLEEELGPEMEADVEELGLSSIPRRNAESQVILKWLKIPHHLWPQLNQDRKPAPKGPGTDQAQVNSFVTSDDDDGERDVESSDPWHRAEQWAREKFAYIVGTDARDEEESAIRRCLTDGSTLSTEEVRNVGNVWEQPLDRRWQLYRRWRAAYQEKLNASMSETLELYETLAKELAELDLEETLMLLREAAVVGMTTLGTGRHRTLLQSIKPRIVVFEEAAQVLEAQVLTSLTPDCQHLIMIGDHRQLRPKVTDPRIGTKLRLDVSLFERMIANRVPFVQLGQQGAATNIIFQQHRRSEALSADSRGGIHEH